MGFKGEVNADKSKKKLLKQSRVAEKQTVLSIVFWSTGTQIT